MTKKSKFGVLAGVSMVAFSVGMGSSWAQESEDAAAAPEASTQRTMDTIVVTGFRQSLAEALDVKRNSNGVVDAIVSEDIADFPDLNLAESLQRIPGIAINRQAGEGRSVTVRGLGGNFTRVRINGMEAVSTTGGSDAGGGSNRTRTFDFNTFSSDLFGALVVRKSQSAGIEEGSLGANIEMKTVQPFDFDEGVTATVSAQGLYNDLEGNVSPRGSGLVSFQNDAGNFGVLLGGSYSDRKIREEGFSTVRFDDAATFRSVEGVTCADNTSAGCTDLTNSWYPRIPRYGRLDYEQERIGLVGSMQFRPTEATTVSLDALYSTFKGQRDENFLEVFVRGNTDNVDVTDYSINSDGVLETLTGNIQPDAGNGIVPVRSERRIDLLETEFTQFTGEVEHDFSDKLRGSAMFGTSESTFNVPQQATIFFDAADTVTGYNIDFSNNLQTPSVSFGDLDVTDPTQFVFTSFRNRPQGVDNSFDTFKADLEYDISTAVKLSGGVSWKKFEFETREGRNSVSVTSIDGIDAFIPVTDAIATTLDGFGDGLGASGIDTAWVVPDFYAAADLVDLFSFPTDVRERDTRGVEEESTGGFVQVDFDTDISGMMVRGDIGVRYVETKVASTGILNGEAVTINREYSDVLPAANIVIEPTDELVVRAGVAKVMSRPSLGNLSPGGSLDTFGGDPYTLTSGNPGLDPFRATAFDLSLEYYFTDEAVISVGAFYKDIESFSTASDSIFTTFSGTGIPASSIDSDSPLGQELASGADPVVEQRTTVNGGEGSVQGLEIVYQQPFTFLPIEGFGFTGNYTYVESDELIGFSPNSWNATLYYENDAFAARITSAARDAYRTRRPNGETSRTAGREERGVDGTFNLDFSSSYQVTEALQLTFEAINLTDEFEHQIFDSLDLPNVYHHTGRNFIVGAKYKF